MPPKEESTGLFSKVVKFVKNPTTNWADLDQEDSSRESAYSKQMLKEMIERKRRNDFVRKREFDMLRKMRRSEVMAGQDPAARPSFFQSSMPSKPDDRASTLKKIDEIEAEQRKNGWQLEVFVSAEHKHDFVAREEAATPEAAMDQCVHKVEQQLRRYKERVQEHRDAVPHGGTSHARPDLPEPPEMPFAAPALPPVLLNRKSCYR